MDGRVTYLQEALAGPRLALLLCGDSRTWDPLELDRLQRRYPEVLATYRLGTAGSDHAMLDHKGQAHARLAGREPAQYLVRPDGYIAFRSAGRTFEQLDRYLARWYVASQ